MTTIWTHILLYHVSQVVTQMRWVVSLHTRPYAPVGFMHIFYLFIFHFLPNLFSNENYQDNYVTKKIPWKSRGVSKVFLADQVRLCYMRTEHIYYQRSFDSPSTIF